VTIFLPRASTSILDLQMTPETRRRLRREAESLIETTLNAPDLFAAAVALLSDEVVDAIAAAICTTVLSALDL
jgi:hypothetical protein